ncbi:MAG: capsular polysaccharide synthesis protein [Muribaculaceae bacterium]|nr:capsular polysaccharide synthesis protein [Muribaculaceae bacterium]
MSTLLSRAWGRTVKWLQLIVNGHILNPIWHSREERRKTRYRATYNAVMDYLWRYNMDIEEATLPPISEEEEPERAFTIWFQGEENAPELVKACFRSMRRHLKQELVVLDEKTLFDWISLPDFVIRKWREGKIPHTQFSDICRAELLYRHGGLWFDATDYVTAPVPQSIMDQDVFIFMAGEKIRGSYAFIQSCFLRAKKGNPLMGIWREADLIYWKEENSKINYFVHHLLLRTAIFTNDLAARSYVRMPKIDQDPTHALWGEHAVDPYSPQLYEQLTSGSFFQKTNYKDRRLKNLPKGSIAEFMINQ